MSTTSRIIATGSYIPEQCVRNADLGHFPKNALPLIEKKTGVTARHYAAPGQYTSDLAAEAARRCLAAAATPADAVDAIILATSSPDRPMPATATRVQSLIGASRAFAFDLNAVCSGGVYAVHLADALIRSGQCRHILVLAAEVYSRILNPVDFSTYPYFGDGAGAVLLSAYDAGEHGVLRTILHADGSGADLIQVPAGGSMMPPASVVDQKSYYFAMNGREVFEFATRAGPSVILELLAAAGVARDAVAHVVLHQANINIVDEIARRTDIPRDRFFVNLDRVGNTAAASVMIALDELISSGRAHQGQLVVIASFGGGLSWGASLIRL